MSNERTFHETFERTRPYDVPPSSYKRLLLTGGGGFLGTALRVALKQLPYNVYAPRSAQYDLTHPDQVDLCYQRITPHVVVHAACPFKGSGIGYAQASPATLACDMVRMDALLIQATKKWQVQTFIGMSSVCAYPEVVESFPTTEDQILAGPPEVVNGFYGTAKRTQLSLLQAARREWGLNGVHLILANLYGPGDKFGSGPTAGHVIPATIIKCADAVAAGAPEITAWGDGSPTRSFLHIADAAAGVVAALEQEYASPVPLNICTEEEISVRALVESIAQLVGFEGRIRWDQTKPNGQLRRLFSNAAARKALKWTPTMSLRVGLKTTVDWYHRVRTAAPSAEGA